MPYKVAKSSECPASKPWGVIKEGDGEVMGCHESEEKAQGQQAALYAAEADEERGIVSKFRDFLNKLRGLVDQAEAEAEQPAERATSLSQVAEQFWAHLGETERWDAWPMDIFLDGDGIYMLVTERGKLYRVPVSVEGGEMRAGEWQEVEVVHQPVGRTHVIRQADGQYRWFSIAATAVLNRVGEIDSTALFDALVARFKEDKAAGEPLPGRDFFHLGEPSVFGDVDLLERDGWVLMASGTFHDTPLGQAMRRAIEAEPGKWGDSISYLPLAEPELVEVAEGVRVPVYNDGKLRFISSVYEARAASIMTTTVSLEEVNRMRQEVLEALQGLKEHGLPDETIDALVATVDSTNRAIDDEDMIRREAETETEAGEETETDAGQEPDEETDEAPETGGMEPAEFVLDDEALEAIARQVEEGDVVAGLQAQMKAQAKQIADLEAGLADLRTLNVQRAKKTDDRLAALERDDEEKRRDWVADLPAKRQINVTHRPRKDAPLVSEESLAARAEQTLAMIPGK